MTTRRTFLTQAAAVGLVSLLPFPALSKASPEVLSKQEVSIDPKYQPGEIVIVPSAYFLYYVTAPGKALRYGIAVAKPGLAWKGKATIKRKVEWPTWRPTDDMIERNPREYGKYKDNEDRMEGGPRNPLGARALYLFDGNKDTYIRIHATTAPRSIGSASSNGCFRMLNENVIDLYGRVPIGTKVTVL